MDNRLKQSIIQEIEGHLNEKIEEINIGEAVFARSFWIGMEQAVRDMIALVH